MIADALQCEEGAVAFIHVPAGRRNPERLQDAHAAQTNDQLLTNAHFTATNVKLTGNGPISGCIFRGIRIEQQDRYAADLCQPNTHVNIAPRKWHADRQVSPIIAEQRQDR